LDHYTVSIGVSYNLANYKLPLLPTHELNNWTQGLKNRLLGLSIEITINQHRHSNTNDAYFSAMWLYISLHAICSHSSLLRAHLRRPPRGRSAQYNTRLAIVEPPGHRASLQGITACVHA